MKILLCLIALLALALATPTKSEAGYEYTLTWQDNSDNEDGFKIERKSGPTDTFGEIATVGANVTTYTDNVADGQQRCYRVRAFNAAGNSAYTNEACGLPTPGDPTQLTITITITVTVP